MYKDVNIDEVVDIAYKAGDIIMSIYSKDFDVEYKDDSSPLTIADIKSNEIICENLKQLYPQIPILSEENKEIKFQDRKDWKYYWCIDPIDGTKEFVSKNGEFTVNIALIENNIPVLGVVYAPVIDKMYSAKKGKGAFLNKKQLPLDSSAFFSVVASRSHSGGITGEFIESLKVKYKDLTLKSMGSSLKICMIAENIANIYPRIAPTMEWDTAAAHAIILEVGKNIYQYDENIQPLDYLNEDKSVLNQLEYNKENLLNPSFVVV
jgi:3'(2'), 5'-bisphosphate nucleotidase